MGGGGRCMVWLFEGKIVLFCCIRNTATTIQQLPTYPSFTVFLSIILKGKSLFLFREKEIQRGKQILCRYIFRCFVSWKEEKAVTIVAASFLCASTAITGLKDCEISCCFVFRSDLAITFYPTLTWSLQFLLICVIIKNNICPVYIWDQRMYYFSLWSPGPLFFIVFTVSFCIKSSFF